MPNRNNIFLTFLVFTCLHFSPMTYAETTKDITRVQDFEKLIASHKGKVIYLDFWASWCGPCRKSFPWLNNMQLKHKQQGFIVISVNVDNEKALAEEFLSEVPANFIVFYDPKGEVAEKFKLRGMPSSYLINRAGKITSAHVGFSTSKKNSYEKEIVKLL